MLFKEAELMGAVLATAALAMLLQPLSTPRAHPGIERLVRALPGKIVAEYSKCALGEQLSCAWGP